LVTCHLRMKSIGVFLILLLFPPLLAGNSFVQVKPVKGDGIYSLLRRYQLPTTTEYINKFKEINNLSSNDKSAMIIGKLYKLPILKYAFDGKTIRSSLDYDNYRHAKEIENYNKAITRAGLKAELYTRDMVLWVPFFMAENLPDQKQPVLTTPVQVKNKPEPSTTFPIFGSAHKVLEKKDSRLQGCVYYLDAGHGGPDPGAVGTRAGIKMCEDEYAYDITLRLAKRLMEHGAKVYMIVQDSNDGIRDQAYLKKDSDEKYYGNQTIPYELIPRLEKRAAIVNTLYGQNNTGSNKNYLVVIHVDSRSFSKRIDIFYYYKTGDVAGKKLATTLYKTVKEKYSTHQPGRGYGGKVIARDLYMLRNTLPTAVYIELGNIKNPLDQDRLVIENNRQAVANWLCEGLIKAAN